MVHPHHPLVSLIAMGSPPPTPSISVACETGKFILVLWSIALGLVGIHLALNLFHYEVYELPWLMRQIFDVDEEDSFPTWFSGFLLLLTSVTCGLNARRESQLAGDNAASWTALGLGFLLLSIDEIAGMHETFNSMDLPFSWTVPGAIAATFAGGLLLPFLLRLPRKIAVRFVLGGVIYLGGALGVEVLTDPYLENDELNTLAYNLWTALEEFMEMGGVILFLEGARRTLIGSTEKTPGALQVNLKLR